MGFPTHRLRRLRQTPLLRRLVRETVLTPDHWVFPLFVRTGRNVREAIRSMPGQFRWTVDRLGEPVDQALEVGVRAFILFGLPEAKDEVGSGAYAEDGIVQTAIRELRRRYGAEVLVIADVCLCEYTSHGHCGVIRDGRVDNDATLDFLAQTAVSLAAAGADVVAPSAMMDGQVQAIRRALDEGGFAETPVLAYAAKFASCFYGPFREAADSAPAFGDRRAYQMPFSRRAALHEVALDVEEGADVVMVKPALAYLDVIAAVRERWPLPVAAYNVSGEYAMVKAAAAQGWIDEARAVWEVLTAIHRAGADVVLTYHAVDAARWLRDGTWDALG